MKSNSWDDYPHLLADLDMTKNKELFYNGNLIDVLDLAVGTGKKLDWKCVTCEHEWRATGDKRTLRDQGCSACVGSLHSDGRNSMFTTHPDLAKEYQGDANLIVAGTNKKLDWKCSSCEHEWNTTGNSRFFGSGCAPCTRGDLHSDGRNSMFNTHPELALEYQGDATSIIAGTIKKIEWNCSICDHEWLATGTNRVRGRGCPSCTNKVINNFDGRNSLFNTHPKLAVEYQGDAKLIVAGTNKKLDWKCSVCNEGWKTTGSHRVEGTGCPNCATLGYDPSKIGYVYIHQYVDDTTHWLKCGITGKPADRFKQLSRAASIVNIEVEQLDIYTFDDGWLAQTCERELLDTLELRFTSEYDIEGKSEFFKYSALEEVRRIINKYL